MVALDTNVIVRCIVKDDPLQAKAATRIFEKEISRGNKGFIGCIALCETDRNALVHPLFMKP